MRKFAFLVLATLFVPLAAQAQGVSYIQSRPFVPTSCSALAINAAKTCEIVNLTAAVPVGKTFGWSVMTLEMKYVHGSGAATGYTFRFEQCVEDSGTPSADCTDSTDWSPVQVTATSAAGVTTLLDESIASGALSAANRKTWTILLNYNRLRIAALIGTGSPTIADTVTPTVILARGR